MKATRRMGTKDAFRGAAESPLVPIENGNVIHDGHTVGADAHEHVRVVEVDSSLGLDRRVLRLTYGTARADGPH
jgi:hypothetical protein